MKRKIQATITVPPIRLSLDPEDFPPKYEFNVEDGDFSGDLSIQLDPDKTEWEDHDEIDPQTGDVVTVETVPSTCSGIVVSLESDSDVTATHFLEYAYLFVTKQVSGFLDYIRNELGQYWVDIGPIQQWGLIAFVFQTNAKWITEEGEKRIGIPIGGYQKKIPLSHKDRAYPDPSKFLKKDNQEPIRKWIVDDNEVPLEQSLLNDARRHLKSSDYRTSSVEAITALEGPIYEFVKQRCQSMGISNNSLKDYRRSHFIADHLKILFPLVLEPDELTKWLKEWMKSELRLPYLVGGEDVLAWAIDLNSERNHAVHRGQTPEFDTLDKGLFAVQALVEFATQNT